MHIYQAIKRHISSVSIFRCYNMQHFLYRTVTREKAAKHVCGQHNQ